MKNRIFKLKRLYQYRYEASQRENLPEHYRSFFFRELTREDFFNNSVFATNDRRSRYLNHLNSGHRCFGFIDTNNQVAAYYWLTTGPHAVAPVFHNDGWQLADKEAYIWDCRTVNQFQRQGLYREGLKRLAHFCHQNNATSIMISTTIDNKAAQTGIVRAGFQCCGAVTLIFFRWFKLIFCRGQRPRCLSRRAPATTSIVFPFPTHAERAH